MPAVYVVSLVYAHAALIALAAAAIIWPRRSAPGGTPLVLMLVAAAFWVGCDAVELYMPTAAGRERVSQMQYLGVVSAAPFFFHAALALAGRTRWLTPPLVAAVWVVPILSLLFAWTNPLHHWIWTEIVVPAGPLPFATYRYGWWFWVLTVQHYLLMASATFILLRSMRRVHGRFRPGMAAVLVAAVLPWIGNAAYNAKIGPWPGFNWLALALGLAGGLLAWVVAREGLLDLLPRAREALLEGMTDGILVMDRGGHVIFANPPALDLLPTDPSALALMLGVASVSEMPDAWRGEAPVETAGGRRWVDVRVDPVRDRWGALAGRLLVARDVTMQKTFDDERERLIDELQTALGKVTHLEGLLPICAQCRKVRDDSGYWEHVEEYFGSRAPVEFTHAICPDCARRLYPSIMEQ